MQTVLKFVDVESYFKRTQVHRFIFSFQTEEHFLATNQKIYWFLFLCQEPNSKKGTWYYVKKSQTPKIKLNILITFQTHSPTCGNLEDMEEQKVITVQKIKCKWFQLKHDNHKGDYHKRTRQCSLILKPNSITGARIFLSLLFLLYGAKLSTAQGALT